MSDTNTINDGGPAFPILAGMDGPNGPCTTSVIDGMTLRDYFAAAVVGHVYQAASLADVPDGIAFSAYAIADAMLKARTAR